MTSISQLFLYSPDRPLLFSQLYFWLFYFLVFLVFTILYRKKALRNAYLFLVSLFFYYKSGGYFFSLLILSTLVDYSMGLLIFRSQAKAMRRFWVFISLLVNLGVLAYFKYAYFFNDTLNALLGTDYQVVDFLGLWTNKLTGSRFDISHIILPVGISFFTFQTISYTMDVYRRKMEPVRNILDFGFYVSFFPQLVAGPIVRASTFIPQLYQDFRLSRQEMWHALFLILGGLVKKMVISDYISINFVDRIFENPAAFTGVENLLAVYGYSVQIYCDFSGYTDIAIGVALLMGFRLPVNFNSPYKARGVGDFWRRWHISLSTWLRDYLYIPLGGNRKGRFRLQLNLLVTMLLGGLWHGAHLRFIIWGGLHGLALIAGRAWRSVFRDRGKSSRLIRFFQVFLTFHFVTFLWIFFRSENMERAGNMIRKIVTLADYPFLPGVFAAYRPVFLFMTAALVIHWLPSRTREWYRGLFIRLPYTVKLLAVILVVFLIIQVKSAEIQPFIYFRF